MSLRKHALQMISVYIIALVGGAVILRFWAGATALWCVTVLYVLAAIFAWRWNRQLVVPNTVESAGVAPVQPQVLWGFVGIALILAVQLLGNWLESVLFHQLITRESINVMIASVKTAPGYLLVILIAAPILEELVFRRVIFGNLVGVTGVFGAALISALLFALSTDPTHWLTATLVGIVYAYIYRHTGSISTPLLAHIGTIALTLLYAWSH